MKVKCDTCEYYFNQLVFLNMNGKYDSTCVDCRIKKGIEIIAKDMNKYE